MMYCGDNKRLISKETSYELHINQKCIISFMLLGHMTFFTQAIRQNQVYTLKEG